MEGIFVFFSLPFCLSHVPLSNSNLPETSSLVLDYLVNNRQINRREKCDKKMPHLRRKNNMNKLLEASVNHWNVRLLSRWISCNSLSDISARHHFIDHTIDRWWWSWGVMQPSIFITQWHFHIGHTLARYNKIMKWYISHSRYQFFSIHSVGFTILMTPSELHLLDLWGIGRIGQCQVCACEWENGFLAIHEALARVFCYLFFFRAMGKQHFKIRKQKPKQTTARELRTGVLDLRVVQSRAEGSADSVIGIQTDEKCSRSIDCSRQLPGLDVLQSWRRGKIDVYFAHTHCEGRSWRRLTLLRRSHMPIHRDHAQSECGEYAEVRYSYIEDCSSE